MDFKNVKCVKMTGNMPIDEELMKCLLGAGGNIVISTHKQRVAPKETDNIVEVAENGYVTATKFIGGLAYGSATLFPEITDVSVLNDSVVIVTFKDGSEEKAVLSGEDTFSIEQGVSICFTKKLISTFTGCNGSSVYNKLVELGMAVYNNKLKAIETQKIADAEKAARAAKRYEKAKRRKEKRAAALKAAQEAEREAQIEIQKEAYLRAMREYKTTSV